MISRRDFMAGSAFTLLGTPLPHGLQAAGRALAPGEAGRLFVETETTAGRVQGLQSSGIKIFKGIPYGAATGGDHRFGPPRKPAPWARVRECLDYGQICPQTPVDLHAEFATLIHWDLQPGGMGEDCLNLNVWTPGLRDGGRRPVLVSFHGGGFTSGSANAAAYDGAQLALAGDVVVIGVNHRLGVFGYLQLADLGAPPEFAQAGVAGIMDLGAALGWVRENAENFGGDPGNVMIFGQSGGGAKVCSLLAAQATQGLFHRAAVQSGSLLRFATREQATQQANALLKTLDLSRGRVTELRKFSWQQLLEAQSHTDSPALGARPVLDGRYFTHHPFDPAAPEESASVPLIVSTTLEDAALRLSNFELSEAGLREMLAQRFEGRGAEMLALYRRYYPDKSPFLIQAQVFTDAGLRRAALHQAELKAAQGKGAIYVYEWDWPTSAYGGRYGAVHGLDVPASFHDPRDGNDMARLAAQLSAAWVAFARTGNPACAPLPPWPGYDVTTRATLVFGTPTQMVNDPRGELRQFWQHMPVSDGGAA